MFPLKVLVSVLSYLYVPEEYEGLLELHAVAE